MGTGSIVFGPTNLVPDRNSASGWSLGSKALKDDIGLHACNCIGPQGGERKCPCALRGEAEQGRKMILNGVTINGKRYKLVEETGA